MSSELGKKSREMRKTGILFRILFAGIVSAGVLLICSKNSPLYPMNDWVDVHCFFTVGRGIRHGLVPYLDLYEQKGPLLYYLYALASMVSETSFLGVFLLEASLFASFLYLGGRTAEMLSGTGTAFWLTAAGLGIGIPLSPAFSHGGSAEEFFLPAFAAGIYIVLRAMKERRSIRFREGIWIGALTAAALWTKYTFCGLYLGLGLAVLVWILADRKGKELLKIIGSAVLGFAVLTAAVLAWYILRGALPALWKAYFTDNLTLYSQNIRSGAYDPPLKNLLNNLTWFVPAAAGMLGLLATIRKNWRELLAVFLSAAALFAFTYANGRRYPYYAMVMAVFAPFGYAVLFRILPAVFKEKGRLRWIPVCAAIAAVLLSPFAAKAWSRNVYLMSVEKEEMPQYRFAETIRNAEDPTILNYGFLDGGFYYAAETLPVTRFFCTLNNNLEDMQKEMKDSVAEGKTGFVVTRQRKLKDAPGYALVDECSLFFEGMDWTYYLYQRK